MPVSLSVTPKSEMMTISLFEVSKRFNRDWIFRNLTYNFTSGHSYAITGPNGSGKSTLLQVIGGAIAFSEGEVFYTADLAGRDKMSDTRAIKQNPVHKVKPPESSIQNPESNTQNKIPPDQAFRYISIAAPYLEVVEEMTATEFLTFHHKFKPLLQGCSIQHVISKVGLEKAAHRQIRYYSSGMKQRIKLAQAVFSDTPCILLDEPCTNLDVEGVQLYHELVNEYCKDRLVIVSSNDIQEYGFCEEKISILDYKSDKPISQWTT
jgi:ABC-type multidrug transport system ATPase subunit